MFSKDNRSVLANSVSLGTKSIPIPTGVGQKLRNRRFQKPPRAGLVDLLSFQGFYCQGAVIPENLFFKFVF
jgi:hypothetical protein